MLSVSYADKNAYSAGKTSGVLRGGASGANRGLCWPTVPSLPLPLSTSLAFLVAQNLIRWAAEITGQLLLFLIFPDHGLREDSNILSHYLSRSREAIWQVAEEPYHTAFISDSVHLLFVLPTVGEAICLNSALFCYIDTYASLSLTD